MTKSVFAYTAPGAAFPEYLSINERDGALLVTVRTPPAGDGEGATATMTLPQDKVPELAARLSAYPPVAELRGSLPVVLFFASEVERRDFIATFEAVKPEGAQAEVV